MENLKKIVKNKDKVRTQYTLKIMKILKTASAGSNLTGFCVACGRWLSRFACT